MKNHRNSAYIRFDVIPKPSSIMHYDSFGNGALQNPAILNLDGSIIKPNTKMSHLDIVALNKMYPCQESCDGKNTRGEKFSQHPLKFINRDSQLDF